MPAPPDEFLAHILDALRPLGPVRAQRMFSGAGLSLNGTTFALYLRGDLHFRVDDSSRPDYEAAGAAPFRYTRTRENRQITVASYYAVPAALLDDPDELCRWARRAYQAALAVPRRKKRKAKATLAPGG